MQRSPLTATLQPSKPDLQRSNLILNLDLPPGFQAFDYDKPIQWYFRNLPHARQDGATYCVTFRLADSLPRSKLDELKIIRDRFRDQYNGNPPKVAAENHAKEVLTRIEKWLDLGAGECQLKQPRFGNEIASAMQFFSGQRYQLNCFVVMPNHVHLIVKPTIADKHSLEAILHSWKRHSAFRINQLQLRDGPFWQPESYDRIIRDAEHLYRVVQYIGRNPKLAGLNEGEFILWMNPQWEHVGWGFRED